VKVLLATDGERPSEEACNLIVKLADRKKIDLMVMAVEGFDMALEEGARAEGKYSRDVGRKHALGIVDRTVEQLIDAGFRAAGHVQEGYPAFEILHEIESGWHEVTVLGSGKASWLGQLMLGSVSTKVLHGSPTSVVIVHKTNENASGKVLIGTDGSRGSEFAVRAVVGLCDPERTEIQVTSGVRLEEAAALSADSSGSDLPGQEELMPHLRHQAEQAVDHARGLLSDAGFSVTGGIVEGHPAEVLLRQAEEGDFDLVAVGSRGRGALERVLLGSVSDRIVRHAPASLVARRKA
jgi:nucleotide-binding universal stress UspA family protein